MIKNIDTIKAKAKTQIIDLLNRMGCYTFTESGIDKWLKFWEAGCGKQIVEIAEKHPYYDGDCKIVFPSKYQRSINTYAVNEFINWLYDFPKRNLEEETVFGFTYKDAFYINELYNNVYNIRIFSNRISNMPEGFDDGIRKFSDIIDDYRSWLDNGTEAKYQFNTSSKYTIKNNKAFHASKFREMNKVPSIICDFLSGFQIQQFLNDDTASYLRNAFPELRFSKGQKLSRAILAIAKKYNLTSDPEWEREFAKFADAVNPLEVVKWTVISWHPIDYLTFCFGDSWSSCCNIDKDNVRGVKCRKSKSSITSYVDDNYEFRGDHSAAALSYMFDNTSFIYYTVSDKYKGKLYEEQDKNTRIVFSLSDDMTTLIETRLYPQCNDDNPDDSAYRIPREIIQKVICDSLDVPNLWTIKKGTAACRKYAKSVGVHYADYADERNRQCNISYIGDNPSIIHIGHNAICPYCGRIHDYIGSLNCRECDPCY